MVSLAWHERESLVMEGGTAFYFATAESRNRRGAGMRKEAAGSKDVKIGGRPVVAPTMSIAKSAWHHVCRHDKRPGPDGTPHARLAIQIVSGDRLTAAC